MAWCRQASSHYLNPCWPRTLPPYGITRPYWVSLQGAHKRHYTACQWGCYMGWLLCIITRADSRLAPSQWETLLQSNALSHWLGANLESALHYNDATRALWNLKLLSTRLLVEADIKGNIKAPHYRPFVRGIHRWPGDSPHKGPVTQKSVSCQDVIMFTSWFMLRHSHCGKVLFNCMDENLSIFWIIVIQVYAFWHFLLVYLSEFVSCFIQIMSPVLYHRWVYLESWGSFCKYFAITYHGYAMKRYFSYFYLFIWKQLALNKRA